MPPAARPLFGGGCHGESHTTGRYAGRMAAAYAKTVGQAAINQRQVEKARTTAYAPLKQPRNGIGWKEINAAIARIMQDYCGQYKNELTLTRGLQLLADLRSTEFAAAYASNPHELGRLLECDSLISVGEMVMHSFPGTPGQQPAPGFPQARLPRDGSARLAEAAACQTCRQPGHHKGALL